jgi:hypothetical protein
MVRFCPGVTAPTLEKEMFKRATGSKVGSRDGTRPAFWKFASMTSIWNWVLLAEVELLAARIKGATRVKSARIERENIVGMVVLVEEKPG